MFAMLGRRFAVPVMLATVAFFCAGDVSWAQKKKPAPPVSAGTPTLDFPLPLGFQRGVATEMILTGTNLLPAGQLWAGFPGKFEIVDDETLNAAGKVKVLVTAPADAPLGLYPIRLAAEGGLSNLRLIAVDELPQIVDNGANQDKAKAQAISTPCVVAGKIEAEKSDYYKFSVKAGQRLNFEVLGRRLGSPIDPCLSLYSAKSPREIAHDNDSPGCQGDPRLSYTFKEGGDYVVEVRDVLGRGGADYVYRLRIGDFPLATATLPMAAKAGSKVQVQFAGPSVDGVKPVDVAVPSGPVGGVVWVTPKAAGQSGWPVPLVISDVEEVAEKEPNQKAGEATRIPLPGGATGRFLQGDEIDLYVATLKKGQKVAIEAQTLEWGSSTLVYFVVKNPKSGAELAKSNPALVPPLDQRLEFTAAEDGDHLIEVQHLLYQTGPAEAYHLSVRPTTPSFEVILSIDKTEAAAGSIAPLPFAVTRKNFTGPIEVRVVGSEPPIIAKLTGSQSAGILLLPSKGDASLGARSIVVEGKAMIDGQPVTVIAHAKPTVSKALADLTFLPMHVATNIAVGVKGKAPFQLSAKVDPVDPTPGSPATVTVTATRSDNFKGEIVINPPAGLPANVGAKVVPIPADKTEVKFPLDVTAKAALGEYYLLITGKAKADKRDIVSDPAVLPLIIAAPFELSAEPKDVTLAPGGKTKLTLKVTRKAGFKGTLAIDVKNLPADVTADKATVAPEQASVDIQLTAGAKALPLERIELEIVGVVTATPNLFRAAPPVALRIGKK